MKTDTHIWSYLTRFFLQLEMFRTNALDKIETHILFQNNFFFFSKNRAVYEII